MYARRFIENGANLVFFNEGGEFTEAIIVPAPTADGHPTTREYVDTEIDALKGITPRWREPLLHEAQLISGAPADPGPTAEAGIAPAAAVVLTAQPVDGDTFSLKVTGAAALTFTFVDANPQDGEIEIGLDAGMDLSELAAAINTADDRWEAHLATDLMSIAGLVMVVVPTAITESPDDRIYGTGPFQVVDFEAGKYDGRAADLEAIPDADPEAGSGFGFQRRFADLKANETHAIRSGDRIATFDDDANEATGDWNLREARSNTAGDGIAITGTSIAVDLAADPGLEFNSGALRVKIEADKGLARGADGLSVLVAAAAATGFDGSGNVTVAKRKPLTVRTVAAGGVSGAAQDTGGTASVANSGGHQPEAWIGTTTEGPFAGPFTVANGAGERDTAAFYYSGDGGTTARAWSAIAQGDELRVNTALAGGALLEDDVIKVTGASLS